MEKNHVETQQALDSQDDPDYPDRGILSYFMLCYRIIRVKLAWYWHKTIQTDQHNISKNPDIYAYIQLHDF